MAGVGDIGINLVFDAKSSDWKIFHSRLTQYFIAKEIKEAMQRAVLLCCLTEDAYILLTNLCVPYKPEDCSYKDLVGYFDAYYEVKNVVWVERGKFYAAYKEESETAQEWSTRLKGLANNCQFAESLETKLTDIFINHYSDGKIKNALYSLKANVKFSKAVEAARIEEATQIGIKEAAACPAGIKTELESEVFKMSVGRRESSIQGNSSTSRNIAQGRETYLHPQRLRNDREVSRDHVFGSGNGVSWRGAQGGDGGKRCFRCGKSSHFANLCPYKNYICNNCGRRGHIRAACAALKDMNTSRDMHFFDVDDKDVETDNMPVFLICSDMDKPIFVEIALNGTVVKFQLDSGAAVSILPYNLYQRYFCKQKLSETTITLLNFSGHKIKPLGKLNLNVMYKDRNATLDFYILSGDGPALLGRDFIRKYNLGFQEIEKVNYLESNEICRLKHEFSTVFSGNLGLFRHFQIKLNLKPNATPKFFKPRPLPFALKDKVDDELDRLLNDNIISPVEFSEWGTPIVPILKKDGSSVRICCDFKITINPFIIADQYPIPRVDELFNKMRGGKQFSKIDLSQAYQQILLHPESRRYTVISTHRGLFQYNRLPFGVSCAPAQFQRLMEQLFKEMPGVALFLDDILITGENKQVHVENLRKVLGILRDAGLTVQEKKCNFFQDSVSYLGFVIDKEGLHKCPNKLKAIKELPKPENVTQLKSFLGTVNYYNRFVNNISAVLAPLYDLLKKDSPWNWTSSCQKAFESIKTVLMSENVLVHFNPNLPINLTVDSSNYGLGAVLSHVFANGTEKPICYASKTLSKAEQGYSALDKEATAIIWGVKRFYQYLYTKKFNLITDNKALVSIFGPKKGIPVMGANRLQRYALFLSGFDFTIKHVKTSQNIADFLSRLPVQTEDMENSNEISVSLNVLLKDFDIPINVSKVALETKKDESLLKVYNFILSGWPTEVVSSLKPYLSRQNELSIIEDVIMWGNRVVVPDSLKLRLLEELHSAHMGVVKMKSIARSYIWWPALNEDIEKLCRECADCQRIKSNPPKVPLLGWPVPEGVWDRIHVDFFETKKNDFYLIILDAFSKWIEVFSMRSITSFKTIQILRNLFARYGLPKQLVSDNGRTFVSKEFNTFMRLNGIEHVTSPPFSPHCNGAAENSVKTVKHFLLKEVNNSDTDTALARFLLTYRSTTHCSTGLSPAEVFLGRSLRTRFDLIKPSVQKMENPELAKVKNNIKIAQNRNKRFYKGNRKANIKVGYTVYVKDYRGSRITWCKGVVNKILGPNVFLVKPENCNNLWKRHANQIRTVGSSQYYKFLDDVEDSDKEQGGSSVCGNSEGYDHPNLNVSLNSSACDVSVREEVTKRPERVRKPPERLCYS